MKRARDWNFSSSILFSTCFFALESEPFAKPVIKTTTDEAEIKIF